MGRFSGPAVIDDDIDIYKDSNGEIALDIYEMLKEIKEYDGD